MRFFAPPVGLVLMLAACNPMVGAIDFHPLVPNPAIASGVADRECQPIANRARRVAARDIWAQGGQPAWHQTYNACMAERGWRRSVALGPGAL